MPRADAAEQRYSRDRVQLGPTMGIERRKDRKDEDRTTDREEQGCRVEGSARNGGKGRWSGRLAPVPAVCSEWNAANANSPGNTGSRLVKEVIDVVEMRLAKLRLDTDNAGPAGWSRRRGARRKVTLRDSTRSIAVCVNHSGCPRGCATGVRDTNYGAAASDGAGVIHHRVVLSLIHESEDVRLGHRVVRWRRRLMIDVGLAHGADWGGRRCQTLRTTVTRTAETQKEVTGWNARTTEKRWGSAARYAGFDKMLTFPVGRRIRGFALSKLTTFFKR
ncbi:hypothetical protein BV25DRAFT_1841847 [Artomyces pyxidatus]|uniref:Uncharacterized protein n=1 Tax=Artomyces pyxidatus TaxID=48021 RepID=A0ACB8SKR6_9AGAM|nr:hypothetical protein BV25DRAFT_1841847 [Artomyces pyxidatus]